MPQFISAAEAVKLIRDGDTLIYNNFLGMYNCEQLSIALNDRFRAEGHPKDLTIYCTAGLGGWAPNTACEQIVTLGAVKKLYLSHYASMPVTRRWCWIIRSKLTTCPSASCPTRCGRLPPVTTS